MAKESIGALIREAAKLKKVQEKVDFLVDNDNSAIRIILKYMYDPNIEFLIPDTPPPYKASDLLDVEGMMYREARRLKIFVKGGGYDNLNKTKRENLFISLLQDIDRRDAEILCQMVTKKPLTGLTKGVINKAYEGLIEELIEEPGNEE